jgi:hypothetical protein
LIPGNVEYQPKCDSKVRSNITQEEVHTPRPIISLDLPNLVGVDMLATALNGMASKIPLTGVHGMEYFADKTLH